MKHSSHTPKPSRWMDLCRSILAITTALLSLTATASGPLANISSQSAAVYNSLPQTGVNAATPLVMLVLSRDHQLHYKAYNDYSPLDPNNPLAIQTTYTNGIDYYGYFDSYKCYTYDSGKGWFVPSSINTDKYCSDAWSGNFLNWLSMTRIDTVRKLLYGGLRYVDTPGQTVLERDYLPMDAHSFAKYYDNVAGDLNRLVPAAISGSVMNTSINASNVTISNSAGKTSFAISGAQSFTFPQSSLGMVQLGDQLKLTPVSASASFMVGWVAALSGTTVTVYVPANSYQDSTSTVYSSWNISNLSSSGITFCNVTAGSTSGVNEYSQTNTNPPLIRVAKGDYALWNANERWQCNWYEEHSNTNGGNTSGGIANSNGNQAFFSGLNASSENPKKASQPSGFGEYNARVQACVYGLEGKEKCKTYPSTNSSYPYGVEKPNGLLQTYGEAPLINFGLITTSYQKNVSGGVLRKSLPSPNATGSSLANEINLSTDGTFIAAKPPNMVAAGGIIDTLDKLRIWGYGYDDGTYYGGGSKDDCSYGLVGIVPTGTSPNSHQATEGSCVSWGNPFGEAYIEALRYFKGGTNPQPTSAFIFSGSASESSLGLTTAQWSDPLNSNNYCASLNVIGFNASVSSYDNDQADAAFKNLTTATTVAAQTKLVGDQEAITPNGIWLIGNDGNLAANSPNILCTVKTIADLSAISGLCPEAPDLGGSYLDAGAAYWAHTNRIRSDITLPTADNSSLKITSYGIQLATNIPHISIVNPLSPADPATAITLLPASRTVSADSPPIFGAGALVDFRIAMAPQPCAVDANATCAAYYVNWEDSAQGYDYDQDLWGIISYRIKGSALSVTTQVIAQSSGITQGFGYVISGTNADGVHFASGINGFKSSPNAGECSGGCNVTDSARTINYTLTGKPAGLLQDPLYYVAKYGGFVDSNGNDKPDLRSEWDSKKADGSPSSNGGDGQPDNYFFVSNPSALEASLGAALQAILAKSASGTSAAVVTSSRQGVGAAYQALYTPRTAPDSQNRSVSWSGTMQGLLMDSAGNLREDGNGDMQLEESDFSADPAVQIKLNPADQKVELFRFNGDPAGNDPKPQPPAALSKLKPLWNASAILSKLSDPEMQRGYSTPIVANPVSGSYSGGRYIFTFRDHGLGAVPANSVPDAGADVVAFIPANFGDGEYSILNVTSAADASNVTNANKLVNYIRGKEYSGLRSRTMDYDGDGISEVLRLGDIVNSTPIAVAAPSESFDQLYADTSYLTFIQKYQGRRNVVYVGANDGMVHAFNAGFYDPATKGFRTTGKNSETAHPLGAELWAYIPFNLLPHLNWLSDPNYGHVWYADGSPRVFDAHIFAADSDHPGGWGTVMVIGMRLGGGPITLPVNAATRPGFTQYAGAIGAAAALTTRSAFVVMDITNPETPPRLIAELTDPAGKLGFTTSYPTAVAFKPSDGSTSEKWYLVFGSGPADANVSTALTNATSSQDAQLFIYDLAANKYVANYGPYDIGTAPNSFIGNPVAFDWDLNYKADVLYFGTSGGTPAAPSGSLYRLDFHKSTPTKSGDQTGNESSSSSDWIAPTALINPGPILATPSGTQDALGHKWILSGTGRFLANPDKSSSAQQYLFGVIDDLPNPASPQNAPVFSSFVDTSKATITTAGMVDKVSGALTETALENLVFSSGGWKLQLQSAAGFSAERSVANTSLLARILFATTYTPATTLCADDGGSRLFAVNFATGAGYVPTPVFGSQNGLVTSVLTQTLNGEGAAPILHVDEGSSVASSTLTVNIQTSDGAIFQVLANIASLVKSGEIDWRETHPNVGP